MELYPLRFEPVFRSYIWGGRRLGDVLGKPIGDLPRYAESWEVVDHGEDQSVVANGPLAGWTLNRLVRELGAEIFGTNRSQVDGDGFPLLLKYLDCNRVLSVQVHPDDVYGQTMNPPDRGKTEAWYVIDAEPGSIIYAGLAEGVDRETFGTAIRTGRVADVLNQIEAKAGQCIFIPAGTVHALGAGILVAEIQQSSDTTFRIFDWDRVGDDGHPRPLHIDQALAVTNYSAGPIRPQIPVPREDGGNRLVECEKFLIDCYAGTQPISLRQSGFRILTAVEGGGTMHFGNDQTRVDRGESFLIPAAVERIEFAPFNPGATLLSYCLPEA
jgi:mannose-6-phosphate isomerase